MSVPPVLALTTGEPAGIGPELVAMLAAAPVADSRVVAVGDPQLLAERAARLGLDLEVVALARHEAVPETVPGRLLVWPVALRAPASPGVLNIANADYVLETLDVAIAACRADYAAGMVTAPLHKGVILDAGHAGFRGHTEYLRDACGVEEVVMMLATDYALHASRPGWRGPAALRVLDTDLKRWYGLIAPRIAVCGLNPHAGEGGHLGREEIEVIEPALAALRAEGLRLDGPLPADTLFTPRHLEGVDAVLAMYHDQGLPVLKYAGFGSAANITLGLPFPRTSVDHGTALDLAGSGRADPGSLRVAVALAAQMASRSIIKS
ncbi:MAG: 4-hydroxythreonine-4-phosphate dehydrogenase PdxA [Halomonas sp.]|nr:4-hydroxythreonine-4-phosphate dehydrogenase PdxA [Halomonas sp.]